MPLRIDGVIFDLLTADPGAPEDGETWYNSTTNKFKVRVNGTTEEVIFQSTLDTHIAATNPHGVTLEQARSQDNAVSGTIAMGSNKITGLAQPTVAGDAAEFQWVLDQINTKLQGLDWQESVLDKDLATPPGSPVTGDRYIVAAGGTGAWSGQDDNIAEWDGSTWIFSVPNEGFTTRVEDENKVYTYDGASWGLWDAVVDHGNLAGLGDDDHTQYLLINGSRAMTGALDMGTNAITNVGLVDGVDVSAHAARHNPGGADALATAVVGSITPDDVAAEGSAASFARSDHTHGIVTAVAGTIEPDDAAAEGVATSFSRSDHQHAIAADVAVELTDSTNAEGASTSFARADHQHAHGDRGGGSLHAAATNLTAGFMTAAQWTKLNDASLVAKATVEVATEANITLSGEQTIDGVLTSGSRVLVRKQTAPAENGIYVSAAGAWTRAVDYNNGSLDNIAGSLVSVTQGDTMAGTLWMQVTADPITINSTSLVFDQISLPATSKTGGELAYFDGTDERWAEVPPGSAGQVLTSNGVGSAPTFQASGGGLTTKAGRVLAGSFSGNPKKATVTFSGAFSDANYAVALTALTTGNKTFSPAVENQAAGSFDINLGSNSTTDLTHVGWIAVKDGET